MNKYCSHGPFPTSFFKVYNEMCLFTDASDLHWGAILTQVPKDQLKLAFNEQHHEPLEFLSESFCSTHRRCSVIEKEAFPIIQSLDKLRHFLVSDDHFRLFSDHRNLIYLFHPAYPISL